MKKNYQRKYLRAPYLQHVLFSDNDFVHKGKGINISEGGILLDEIGHIPTEDLSHFLIYLPQFPKFKNYTFEKIMSFNAENLSGQTIRFSAELIRRDKSSSQLEGVFLSQIGFEIRDISKGDLMKLRQYIDTFSSNLIYMQVLLDQVNSDKQNLEKLRKISFHLGHSLDEKLSVMRVRIESEYRSLQWL